MNDAAGKRISWPLTGQKLTSDGEQSDQMTLTGPYLRSTRLTPKVEQSPGSEPRATYRHAGRRVTTHLPSAPTLSRRTSRPG